MAIRKRQRPLTAPELDDLAVITPEDIERAHAKWREYVPPEAANLLDAKTKPGTSRRRKREE